MKPIGLDSTEKFEKFLKAKDIERNNRVIRDQSYWLKKSKLDITAGDSVITKDNPYTYHTSNEYRSFVVGRRNEALGRMRERKLERILIQKSSNQEIVDLFSEDKVRRQIVSMDKVEIKSKILAKSGVKRLFSKPPYNIWNMDSEKCKKIVDLVYNPLVMKNEDAAIERMKSKILKDEKHNANLKTYQKIFHDVVADSEKRRSKSYVVRRDFVHDKKKSNPYLHFYKKHVSELSENKNQSKSPKPNPIANILKVCLNVNSRTVYLVDLKTLQKKREISLWNSIVMMILRK